MASAAWGRRTWSVLAGLIGDELIEIGVVEHAARALFAATCIDVTQRTGSNMGKQRLDRAAELARGLGGREQAIGRASADDARLARRLYARGVEAERLLGRC